MKGKETLVKVVDGEPLPLKIQQSCVRCGNDINSFAGDFYMCFANVITAEDAGGFEGLVSWDCICRDCSKKLAEFFKTKVYYRGKELQPQVNDNSEIEVKE